MVSKYFFFKVSQGVQCPVPEYIIGLPMFKTLVPFHSNTKVGVDAQIM